MSSTADALERVMPASYALLPRPPAGRKAGRRWMQHALGHAERIVGGRYLDKHLPADSRPDS